VVAQRPIRSVRLAWATFAAWLGAAWLLPSGIAAQQERVTEAGGGLAAVAVTLLVVNLSAPLAARRKGHTVTGLRLALAGLAATACFGMTYVADRRGNWVKPVDQATLADAAAATGGRLVIAEDHYPQGGLAAAVLEALAGTGLPLRVRQCAVGGLPGSGTRTS